MNFPVLTTSLDLLRGVAAGIPDDRLDAPTPCTQWTVTQVLLHAAGDQHAWASTVGAGNPPSYNPFAPPDRLADKIGRVVADAIDAATAGWGGVDPADEAVPTPLPPVPRMPAQLAAAACALDAAVHAWDVAVATGLPSPLTAELAARLGPAARVTADSLRGFAYATALPEQSGEDATAALLRYLGRDPYWAA